MKKYVRKYTNDRIAWADITKGIGIILVIVAHCMNINEWPFQFIYTFHMPLFFILSGWFFDEKCKFRELIKKRVRSLIIPYIIFFIIGFLATICITQWRNELTLSGIISDLWLADPNTVHNSSIWFLMCMFWTQIFFWLICRLPMLLQVVTYFILYAAGILYSVFRFDVLGYGRLPLDLDVVPVAIIFFAVGFYIKKYCLLKLFENKFSMVIITIISIFLSIICFAINGYSNLHGLKFGNPIVYLIGGIAGSGGILGLSTGISHLGKAKYAKSVLCFLGRNSLVILGIQSVSIRLFILVAEKFGISLQLYAFPMKYTLISSVFVGFLWCPLVCYVWEYTKNRKMR